MIDIVNRLAGQVCAEVADKPEDGLPQNDKVSLDVHLENLEARIDAKLKGYIDKIQAKQQKQLSLHDEILRAIDRDGTSQALEEFKGRLSELSDKLQCEILKTTVISEVSRLYPSMWKRIMLALKEQDNWWMSGKNLTIRGWKDRLNKMVKS